MKKRLLSLFMSICMIVSMAHVVLAVEDEQIIVTTMAELQAALSAESTAPIKVTAQIEVTEDTTLNLNGKTVSGVDTADMYSMIHIQNGAALTIVGDGKISYDAGEGKTGAAIWVEGSLIQNGGTIELTGSWNIGFAVDVRPNAWGTAYTEPTSFVMNDGSIVCTDSAVRVASNSSDKYEELGVSFTMYNGTIDSDWDAIFVQHLYVGDLDVTVVNGTVSAENSVLRVYGNAGSDIAMDIEGGSFTGAVKIAESYAADTPISITGGTFSTDVTAYVADGYTLKTYVNDNGETVYGAEPTYTVTITIPEEARIFVEKPNGDRVKAEDDGTYKLVNGTYYYTVIKEGYNTKYGRFTVRGADVNLSVELSVYVPFIPVLRPVYAPNIADSNDGEVSVSPAKPEKGDAVVIVATPEDGYEIEAITVTDKNGEAVTVLDNGNGTYTFVQPKGSVTITVTFAQIVVPDEPVVPVDPDTPDEPEAPNFADVDAEAYYYDAVLWAVEGDITSGTSDTAFSPDDTCTRAQAVTFLWRAAGSPEPASTVMPFTDVDSDAYYYDAVLWAVQNGITGGTTDTTFSPDADCTRAQIVTFLWRYNSAPNDIALNLFADVNAEAYYYSAVLWAVKNNVTNGTSETTFSPDNNCTRAQIVTFMFRCMSELEA